MACKTLIVDKKMLETISSLTDLTRLQIVRSLRINEGTPVNEITKNFKISRPAISHHLKVLKNCGIVRNEKIGQETLYYLERSNVVQMLRDLADSLEQCCK
jgi:DNA-binding transcriptional ArsR family regulator